jgi:hypothetical protein
MRSFRIHQAMLGGIGIEMGTGRLEFGRLAFADGMDVESVVAGRKGGEIEADQDAARRGGKRRFADLGSLRVLQHGDRFVSGGGRRGQRNGGQRCGEQESWASHASLPGEATWRAAKLRQSRRYRQQHNEARENWNDPARNGQSGIAVLEAASATRHVKSPQIRLVPQSV